MTYEEKLNNEAMFNAGKVLNELKEKGTVASKSWDDVYTKRKIESDKLRKQLEKVLGQ